MMITRQITRVISALGLSALLAVYPVQASSAGISTVQIMTGTVQALPSCLKYEVTGGCIFLKCRPWPPSCSFAPSIKVRHYMPDDVVSTYSDPAQHPWMDVGRLLAVTLQGTGPLMMGSLLDAQADTGTATPTRSRTLMFKRADAIGNPVEGLIGGNMTFGFPDFSELMSFPASGLSDIGRQWASVPTDTVNNSLAGVNSTVSGITNLPSNLSNLPGQLSGMGGDMISKIGDIPSNFGNTISGLGNTISSLPDTFSNVMKGGSSGGTGSSSPITSGDSSSDGSLTGSGGGMSLDFTGMLGPFGGNLVKLGAEAKEAMNMMGNVQNMMDMKDQIGQIMGGQVGMANGQDFSNMSGQAALSAMGELICPGGSGLFSINYNSDLDSLFWRGLIPLDLLYPGAWVPGIGEVGNGLVNTWGSIYPRTGQLIQTQPVKGSAVIAARVQSIISQGGQPHLYKRLTGQGNKKYFKVAVDPRWQMLYPSAQSSCVTFGDNDSLGLTSFGDGQTSTDNGYVWNLWHKYECCQREGAFLFAVP